MSAWSYLPAHLLPAPKLSEPTDSGAKCGLCGQSFATFAAASHHLETCSRDLASGSGQKQKIWPAERDAFRMEGSGGARTPLVPPGGWPGPYEMWQDWPRGKSARVEEPSRDCFAMEGIGRVPPSPETRLGDDMRPIVCIRPAGPAASDLFVQAGAEQLVVPLSYGHLVNLIEQATAGIRRCDEAR